jgi:2-octaprenylphenol hydroxylase
MLETCIVSEKKYDVVIVGAGLVGQAIAAALQMQQQRQNSRNSLSIVLVDPAGIEAPALAQSLSDYDLRVSALTAQTQQLLQDVGAWPHIPPEALSPYTEMNVWDAEGTGAVHFSAADLQVANLGHIVENRHTLWALNQALTDSGVEFMHQPVRYLDNRDDVGYTPVVLENGDTLLAQLVIGADGALSRVRQWVGLPTREWDYEHHAIVASVECQRPLAATAWQRFRPQGPLAFLPLANNPHFASIVWSTTPQEAEQLLALDDDAFNLALEQAFEGRLGKIITSSKRMAFPLRQRHAKDYWCDGVVLAGDAAHSIHPLAGQGVNLGFKDAAVLAEELVRGFNKGLDLGSAAVLARYQRRRQADNLITMAAMQGFKELFAADAPVLRLLRNEGMRWFDKLLPVKQHVMQQAMGLKN